MRTFNIVAALSQYYSVDLLAVMTAFGGAGIDSRQNDLCSTIRAVPLDRLQDWDVTAQWYLRASIERSGFVFGKRPIDWTSVARRRARQTCRTLDAASYDVMHLFRLYMAPLADLLSESGFRGRRQLDLDDIESETRMRISRLYSSRGRDVPSRRAARDAAWYAEVERARLPDYDRVFVCSEADRSSLVARIPAARVEVLPNVMREQEPAPFRSRPRPFTFLFVGSMSYYPNFDAVMHFVEDVAPIIDRGARGLWRLHLVGRGVTRSLRMALAGRDNVTICEDAASLTPHYHAADAVVVPLRAGGGTRIKVLEAFAYGVPVVTTPLGVEGIDAADGDHVLVGDSSEAFADRCLRLMNEPELRARLNGNALALLRVSHHPDILTRVLCP